MSETALDPKSENPAKQPEKQEDILKSENRAAMTEFHNLPVRLKEKPKRKQVIREIKPSEKQKQFALTALKGFAESKTFEQIGILAGMKPGKYLEQRVYKRLQARGVKLILADFAREGSIDKPDIEALFTKWAYEDDPTGKHDSRHKVAAITSAKELARLKGYYPDSQGGTRREIIYWKEFSGMTPGQIREVAKALHGLMQGKGEVEAEFTVEESSQTASVGAIEANTGDETEGGQEDVEE